MNLARELDRAIANALTSTKTEPKYRVFKDGKLDYRDCANLARTWSKAGAPAYKQLRELLGESAVLAINDIASWNDGIRRALAGDSRLLPATVAGEDFETVDVYAFVSSGAVWTPFGAHVDFEHSVIIDLEGSGRNVITWAEGADYGQRMNHAKSFFGLSFDWEDYITTSAKQHLLPGEIGIIHAHQPHIFHANGPGMFLGLSTLGPRTVGHNLAQTRTAPISSVIHGASFVPKNDPDIIVKFAKQLQPPRIIMATPPVVDIDAATLCLFGRTVRLDSIEIDLITAGRKSTPLNQFISFINQYNAFGHNYPSMQVLAAKLVLIGAAVVE